jgi:hypothetical protein
MFRILLKTTYPGRKGGMEILVQGKTNGDKKEN